MSGKIVKSKDNIQLNAVKQEKLKNEVDDEKIK